jgi:hypothetical protein
MNRIAVFGAAGMLAWTIAAYTQDDVLARLSYLRMHLRYCIALTAWTADLLTPSSRPPAVSFTAPPRMEATSTPVIPMAVAQCSNGNFYGNCF